MAKRSHFWVQVASLCCCYPWRKPRVDEVVPAALKAGHAAPTGAPEPPAMGAVDTSAGGWVASGLKIRKPGGACPFTDTCTQFSCVRGQLAAAWSRSRGLCAQLSYMQPNFSEVAKPRTPPPGVSGSSRRFTFRSPCPLLPAPHALSLLSGQLSVSRPLCSPASILGA